MIKDYDYLINNYAVVRAGIEHISVLKHFGAEVYKNNKENIDKKLEELEKESDNLLTALENIVNEKEPV